MAETPSIPALETFRNTKPVVRAIFWCATGQSKNRIANHHHHGSVNTSTTNAPIKNQTKGGDSLSYNLSSANRFKKLNWFFIAGCCGWSHRPSIAQGVFEFCVTLRPPYMMTSHLCTYLRTLKPTKGVLCVGEEGLFKSFQLTLSRVSSQNLLVS